MDHDADKEMQSTGTSTNSVHLSHEGRIESLKLGKLIMSYHNRILLGPENREHALAGLVVCSVDDWESSLYSCKGN